MRNSFILDSANIENSPSSMTITQASGGIMISTTPRSSTASRLVSFSPEPPLEAGTSPGQGSRVIRPSSPSASISSSTIHQHDGLAGGSPSGSVFAGRTSPVAPHSRNRSLSRISQSGSMANLMNLITSKSRSRASRGDGGGIDTLSMGMSVEGSAAGGGWFGKACSSFIRPWYGADAEDGSASDERRKAFGETKQVCLAAFQKKKFTNIDARERRYWRH